MTNPVSANISTLLNPFGPSFKSTSEKVKDARPIGDQVQETLFGKRKPQSLDVDDFPDMAELLKKLDQYRRKIVLLSGDNEDDYRLQLADGTIAMIDQRGTIFLGIKFLRQFKDNLPVIVGAMAHEIGHRPQRWQEYKAKQELKRAELDALCRYEETRADLFAGRGLAELEMSCEPMIQFLSDIEEGPHPDYFPAKMRADVIREGWNEQRSAARTRQKFASIWPELERQASVKRHVGTY